MSITKEPLPCGWDPLGEGTDWYDLTDVMPEVEKEVESCPDEYGPEFFRGAKILMDVFGNGLYRNVATPPGWYVSQEALEMYVYSKNYWGDKGDAVRFGRHFAMCAVVSRLRMKYLHT